MRKYPHLKKQSRAAVQRVPRVEGLRPDRDRPLGLRLAMDRRSVAPGRRHPERHPGGARRGGPDRPGLRADPPVRIVQGHSKVFDGATRPPPNPPREGEGLFWLPPPSRWRVGVGGRSTPEPSFETNGPDLRHSLRMTESSGIMSRRPRRREATGRSGHDGSAFAISKDREPTTPSSTRRGLAPCRRDPVRPACLARIAAPGSHPGPRTDSPNRLDRSGRQDDAPPRPTLGPTAATSRLSQIPRPGDRRPVTALDQGPLKNFRRIFRVERLTGEVVIASIVA